MKKETPISFITARAGDRIRIKNEVCEVLAKYDSVRQIMLRRPTGNPYTINEYEFNRHSPVLVEGAK